MSTLESKPKSSFPGESVKFRTGVSKPYHNMTVKLLPMLKVLLRTVMRGHRVNFLMHIRRYCIKCYLWRKLKQFGTDAIKSSYKEAEKKYSVAVDDFFRNKETQFVRKK